jgi:hypothetical protein
MGIPVVPLGSDQRVRDTNNQEPGVNRNLQKSEKKAKFRAEKKRWNLKCWQAEHKGRNRTSPPAESHCLGGAHAPPHVAVGALADRFTIQHSQFTIQCAPADRSFSLQDDLYRKRTQESQRGNDISYCP